MDAKHEVLLWTSRWLYTSTYRLVACCRGNSTTATATTTKMMMQWDVGTRQTLCPGVLRMFVCWCSSVFACMCVCNRVKHKFVRWAMVFGYYIAVGHLRSVQLYIQRTNVMCTHLPGLYQSNAHYLFISKREGYWNDSIYILLHRITFNKMSMEYLFSRCSEVLDLTCKFQPKPIFC